jgi:hypothetical protein
MSDETVFQDGDVVVVDAPGHYANGQLNGSVGKVTGVTHDTIHVHLTNGEQAGVGWAFDPKHLRVLHSVTAPRTLAQKKETASLAVTEMEKIFGRTLAEADRNFQVGYLVAMLDYSDGGWGMGEPK